MAELLDEVGAVLDDVAPMSEESFAAGRARVLAGASASGGSASGASLPVVASRRRWPRALVAAAAVAAATFGTVSFVAAPDASAAAVLNRAAQEVPADLGVGPGHYLHTTTRYWSVGAEDIGGQQFRYRTETVSEAWQPPDWRHAPWYFRSTVTGRREWITGDEASARAAGVPLDPPGVTTSSSGPCGATYRELGGDTGDQCSPGSWHIPTAAFVDVLPHDPDVLRAALVTNSNTGYTPVQLAAGVLSSGQAPRELRAALYRALAGLPAVEITDRAANLDGQIGTAFSSGDERVRTEIIIDPDDGRFLGERTIAATTSEWYAAGTVIDSTGFSTDITNSHP